MQDTRVGDTRGSDTRINIRMVNDNSKEIVNDKLDVSVNTEPAVKTEPVVKTIDIDTINPVISKIVAELTNDPKFLARVDESVKKMLADGKLDSTDIPEIVYLIMDAYNTLGSVRVSKEDLGSFVKLIFQFLVEKYKLLPIDKLPEYESMLMSSVKLVLLTPQVDAAVKNISDSLVKYFICWK
jgi:hypothetical protein